MTDPAKAIIDGLEGVTKKWAKQRKAEERATSARYRRYDRMVRQDRITIREATFDVMEKAYMAASANDTLPAHARQIMYQARPGVQAATRKPLDDQYFTQTLLPDYMQENDVDWDVVFDERGHFVEPRGQTIGLGTIAVRHYLGTLHEPHYPDLKASAPKLMTTGPSGSFGAVLFVEKEGFWPLFDQVGLAERYDIAIMLTKGVSNTAARKLIDEMCDAYDVPLLVLHDFDKAGLTIFSTLHQDTRRYSFTNEVKIFDLGLRLADVEELGLEGEQAFDRGDRESRACNLRWNGANPQEVEYLLEQRVELNALTSDQLVAFVERKLKEHGIEKVVPKRELLRKAYCNAIEAREITAAFDKTIEEVKTRLKGKIIIPDDLAERVAEHLEENPEDRWDDAVAAIAREEG